MRLVTYRSVVDAAARLGVVESDLVIDVERLGAKTGQALPSTMLDFIDLGPVALSALREALDDQRGRWPVGAALPLRNVRLLAPIPRPRKNIFGIGLNYVEHVAESARTLDTSKELPKQPVIFSKPPTGVIGPGDAIEHVRAGPAGRSSARPALRPVCGSRPRHAKRSTPRQTRSAAREKELAAPRKRSAPPKGGASSPEVTVSRHR